MSYQYNDIQINLLLAIAKQSGQAILEVYNKPFDVELKDDKSPLTEADKRSNAVIMQGLMANWPAIPVISEENKLVPYDERKNWTRFWLVDPLDGTKEFIKRNGDFTVNIALIENGQPVLGVVYAPVLNYTCFGAKGIGSFVSDRGGPFVQIIAQPHYSTLQKVKVVGSRSHLTDETLAFVEKLKEQGKEVDFVSKGSSLKLCMVAEGKADVYPRFGPTMEWDTGAAHAVALYAGRSVNNAQTGTELTYNKPDLLNPFFIVE